MAFWPVFCFSAKRNKGCFSVTPAGTRSIVNAGNVFAGPNSPTKFCADGPNFRVHILAILAQKRPNLAKIGIFGHFGPNICLSALILVLCQTKKQWERGVHLICE